MAKKGGKGGKKGGFKGGFKGGKGSKSKTGTGYKSSGKAGKDMMANC